MSKTLSQDIDGRNLMPLLAEPDHSLDRDTLCWHYPHYYPRMTPGSAIRSGKWKLIHFYEDDRVELYDLHDDPEEAQNVATDHPQRAQDLRQELEQWREETAAKNPAANPDWRGQ